ncbi:MAG: metallophosphoesterase, partial [Geodermatophilaceae bacterium]|nr:metallophosphoesterase [Geodermatophilaceae bacterium]
MDDGPVSAIGLVAFLALVLTVLGLMHYYIWWRAVRSTTRPGGPGRRIGTWLIVAAFLLTATAQAGVIFIPKDVATPLAWVGFSWLGFAFYLFLFLLLGELIRLGVRIFSPTAQPSVAVAAPAMLASGVGAGSPSPSERMSSPERTSSPDRTSPSPESAEDQSGPSREVSRRLFLSRSIAAGAGVAAASVGAYGITRAMADPFIRRVPVQIAGLDSRLAGFRIALFSDAHLGTIRRKAAMEQLVDTVNGTEPDMVAVLGDLIDGSVADLGDDVAPLADLQSPYGSFFVTGNHEYYSGAQEWVDYLPDLGVRVLANQRLAIERDGAAFDLAGVNDLNGEQYGDSPDYEAALGGRSPERPVVLLCHQPVSVDKAVEYGVDLQLSGHTHGGQLWPFHYIIAVEQGAVSGLSRINDTQLYVTSGAGFWGPPMRVGADPEIVVIEL